MDFLTDPFRFAPNTVEGPVLVTGAGGCIGAWAVAILARSGVPVIASDLRDDRRRPAAVMGEAEAQALDWESADITDGAGFRDLISRRGVRAIIHLAGLQSPFCKTDPALGARVNVEGTVNVFEAARHNGIRRIAYASSVAIHGMPPGGPTLSTIYGAYKLANEHSAGIYWLDWNVPSVGIRPNVVFGVGRDQGLTSSFTTAIAHAVAGEPFEIPFSGPTSWLYAGEVASAFIAAVSRDGEGSPVFDLLGSRATVEEGLAILSELAPDHRITISGDPIAMPTDRSDAPARAHLGGYPSVTQRQGIEWTFRAMQATRAGTTEA